MICLLPNCAYLSETSRMVAVYKALLARAASVCMATHGGTHEFYLKNAEIPYVLLSPSMTEERCKQFVRDGVGLGNPNQSMYTDNEIRDQTLTQAKFFEEIGAKAVLTGFSLTALLSTRLARVPLATSHAGSCVPPLFERNIMPVPSEIRPSFLRFLPNSWLKRISNWHVQREKMYCSGFNRIARELEIEPIPSFAALMMGDVTLVTDIPEIVGISREEMHAWTPKRPENYRFPAKLRYTGPLFADESGAVPERVEEFLTRRDRPIVYVAITSARTSLVEKTVSTVRKTGARVLAVSTVHDLSPTIIQAQDKDLLIERYLPSKEIMPRVDLAITAGGQGSVQTAMVSGTPLLGLPLQPEQDLNLYLLEKQGAARLLALRFAGSEVMTRLVKEMLAEARYRERAQYMKKLFEREDGAAKAADLLIRLAEGGIDSV